mgnify:CR=1 FL=1
MEPTELTLEELADIERGLKAWRVYQSQMDAEQPLAAVEMQIGKCERLLAHIAWLTRELQEAHGVFREPLRVIILGEISGGTLTEYHGIVKTWGCDKCGFEFHADHAYAAGSFSCPCCDLDALRSRIREALEAIQRGAQ